jgi:uncharacterized tellurite resistance protein B-like protein
MSDPEHRLADEVRAYLLKAFGPGSDGAHAADVTERETQLAAAVLCLSVVRADHHCRQDEHRALERAIAGLLGLGPDDTNRLLRAAEEHLATMPMAQVVDLIDRGYTRERKRRVIEGLWRVAFADAELAPHEEYLVRKVADLLHLSTADLIETKIRAREEFDAPS